MMPRTASSNALTGSAAAAAEVAGPRPAGRTERIRARVRRHSTPPVAVLIVGLLAQLVLSLYWTRNGFLGVDGMYYIASRGGVSGEHTNIFAVYAGHWQPVLMSLYIVLWWIFGLHSYVPYILPAILTHLLICTMLYTLLRRLGVGPWVALVPVWLLLWYGAGGDAWLSDAPFALALPVALGLVALNVLAYRPDRARARWVACGLLTVGLGISITSVVVLLLVTLFLLGSQGWRASLRVVLLPALVFTVWFLGWGRHGGRAHVGSDILLDLPRNAVSVLVLPLGDVVAIPAAGVLLTVCVAGAAVLARVGSPPLRALALAGIAAAAAQTCLSVLANAAFGGLESMSVGRYRYVIFAMLVPAIGLTLDVASRRAHDVLGPTRLVVAVISVAALAAATVNGIAAERQTHTFTDAIAARYLTYLRGTLIATDLGERMLTPEIPVLFVRGQDLVTLSRPDLRHKISIGRPDALDRLETENLMYAGVGAESLDLPAPAGIRSGDFNRPLSQEFGCRKYETTSGAPFIVLSSLEGGQIAVTSNSGTIHTRVTREGEPQMEPRTWPVVPGQTVYIGTSAQLAELQIAFDAGGEFTICRA